MIITMMVGIVLLLLLPLLLLRMMMMKHITVMMMVGHFIVGQLLLLQLKLAALFCGGPFRRRPARNGKIRHLFYEEVNGDFFDSWDRYLTFFCIFGDAFWFKRYLIGCLHWYIIGKSSTAKGAELGRIVSELF